MEGFTHESLFETVQDLDDKEFNKFKWFLLQTVVDGLKPFKKHQLVDADRVRTVDLIRQLIHDNCNEAQIMVNVLKKIRRRDLMEKFYPNVLEESAMETLQELILDTLEQLDGKVLKRFKWFLQQPGNVENLEPIKRLVLTEADNMHTVDLIMHVYSSKAAQIVVNVLKKIDKGDLLGRFLNLPNVHEKSIPDTLKEHIFKALCELQITDFEVFKQHLQQTIPKCSRYMLDEANEIDTVVLIMEYYRGNSDKDDADTLDRLQDILKGSTGSNEKKRSGKQEEPKDAPDASTSTTPRTWVSVSKRWKQKFEKLVDMDDSKVEKFKSLVFGKGKEFCIGQGSNGVAVFLGLRDDGTEVAVKRMSKIHNLYNDLKNDQLYLRLPVLDDPSIVRYVDFVEDDYNGYLVLQLCEYTLEEYITKCPEQDRKRLAEQILNSLRILHRKDSNILHRDIKPQNVLIDIQGKARLADFGISRQIEQGRNTRHTNVAGTTCWKAKETLDKIKADYKRSTDMQVAGMLIHYILSGGYHPFQLDPTKELECQNNISKGIYYLKPVVDDDVVAKDLVEWMIHGEPDKRPEVEQCLAHPFFWPYTRREEYLAKIGEMKVLPALEQYDKGQFNEWKQKFLKSEEDTRKLFEGMDEHEMKKGPDGKKKKKYSDNLVGLLRFIRNLHAHYAEHPARPLINLMEMFPGLFGYVYKFAKEQDWNSRPTLKEMFDFCPRSAFTS